MLTRVKLRPDEAETTEKKLKICAVHTTCIVYFWMNESLIQLGYVSEIWKFIMVVNEHVGMNELLVMWSFRLRKEFWDRHRANIAVKERMAKDCFDV